MIGMDETTKGVIARMRTVANGVESYSSASLNPNELARLAADAVGHLDETFFDVAVGIAYDGILFAAAVAGGRSVAMLTHDQRFWGPALRGKKVIVVDDIIYNYNRLREASALVVGAGAVVVGFAAIVNLAKGGESVLTAPLWTADQIP